MKDHLKSIFETVSDHLKLVEVKSDNQYIISAVNKFLLEATGYTEEQMIGKPIEKSLNERECQYIKEKCKTAIETKKTAFYERVFQVPSGNLTFEIEVHPIFDEYENRSYILFISRNITDRLKSLQ